MLLAATPTLLALAGPVGQVICNLITLYLIVVIVVILMSWFPIRPGSPVYSVWRFLRVLTDPILLPLRRLVPPVGGVLDLSPIIVIIGLEIIHQIVCP